MLKQTMLDQELTFRNQVHELHRLYRTQRTFMVDLGRKEYETCDFWGESSQSSAMPVSNPARYDQLAVESTHSSISTVGSAQPLSRDFSGGHHSVFYNLQQRPHNFQLPATRFLGHANVWNLSHETMGLKRCLFGGDISDSDDLKLSLSIGDKKRRRGAADGKWLHKKTPLPHEIIDLEQDSEEETPEEDANHAHTLGCSTRVTRSGCENESRVSFLSEQILPGNLKKDPSRSVADGRESCQEQNRFNQGSKLCPDGVICEELPNMEQGRTSTKLGLLDLNKVYLDDSSCYSNDPPDQNAVAATNLDQLSKDLGSHNSDSKKENLESTLEHAEGALGRSQHYDVDVNTSPGSCEQVSISDKWSGNQNMSEVAETPSVQLEGRSSCSSEAKPKGHSDKEKSSELDIFIKSAAESLVHISIECSAYFQECGSNEAENDKEEQPEYSSDSSYEAITLKLPESNVDEYCVLSKPFEANGSETKEFGLKLRRGRRFKDFQKEILPGLASLARHEISEDINIMDGVLRSREYRRLRGKMADDGEGWSSPLSRRRSRGKRGGRRNLK